MVLEPGKKKAASLKYLPFTLDKSRTRDTTSLKRDKRPRKGIFFFLPLNRGRVVVVVVVVGQCNFPPRSLLPALFPFLRRRAS